MMWMSRLLRPSHQSNGIKAVANRVSSLSTTSVFISSISEKNYQLSTSNCHVTKSFNIQQKYFSSSPRNDASSLESTTSFPSTKLSVAIVGSGPAGCYTTKYLLSAIQQQQKKQAKEEASSPCLVSQLTKVEIDVLDRLPTPFGLVRSGVAPDHPEVKNVENDFAALFTDTTTTIDDSPFTLASSVEFRGNVTVGQDVTISELQSMYDIVILAHGCETDRTLPMVQEYVSSHKERVVGNEDVEQDHCGVFYAREFVGWYNGHPNFTHLTKEIQSILHSKNNDNINEGECDQDAILNANVVVIGQGNVALDCARILAKGRKGLIDTDVASHALDTLQNGVKRTTILGRRGHIQGAFTIKELRELAKLEQEGHDTFLHVDEDELNLGGTTEASKEELQGPRARPKVRIDKLLRDVASSSSSQAKKEIHLRFLLNPCKLLPDPTNPNRLGSILCEKTVLQGEAGRQVAVSTSETEEIPADMVLVSIGYKGVPLNGMDDDLFDHQKGIVKNTHGKVPDTAGLYVSGWLKRGPTGIIGTNIIDAKDTVASVIKDIQHENIVLQSIDCQEEGDDDVNISDTTGRRGLDKVLTERSIQSVNWSQYQMIDSEEKSSARKRTDAQPREKFTSVSDMMNILGESK